MDSKLIGGILLIIGTAIGGGMLALPITTSPQGFISSTILLFMCWFIMTASAFLLLEVNLWLPRNKNIISMAKLTLGRKGQFVAWVTYLFLLYSLLAAYIAGGSDFLNNIFTLLHFTLPHFIVSIIFTAFFGYVVFHGIKSVDLVNRFLMLTKFGALIFLVLLISPHVSLPKLQSGNLKYMTTGMAVAITSFGYATIIPSLRTYFHNDVKKLRLAIIIGSIVPLLCYILWDMTVMGVIPREGDNGLIDILGSNRSISEFVHILSHLLQRDIITTFATLFTSICLLTSFLGVALCLSDFLADGLGLEKTGINKLTIHGATFLPPLLIVLFYPGAFIAALGYAGTFCVILIVILPVLMVWYGRYQKKIAQGYQVRGGKVLLIFLMLAAILIIAQSIFITT
jgi:tyrosine-specific transport protein